MIMDSSDEPLKYVLVVCPTCQARLYPEPGESERIITCPDCFVDLPVPSRAEAEARRASEQRRIKLEDAEPYELTNRPAVREAGSEQSTVTCPHCGVRLTPILERRARTMLCPECFEEIQVPAREDTAAAPRKKRRRRERPALDELEEDLWKPEERPRRRTLADVQGEVHEEPTPEPPRWTFFSRVFELPWRADAISRWAWLSVGWIATGLLGTYLYSLAVEAFAGGDRAQVLTLAFFALPAIWIAIWTLSYTAACVIPVIMDTANGNDLITTWPEPNWREWAGQLVYMGFLAVVVQALAIAAGKATAPLFGSIWPGDLATFLLLYPIVLLSSLEADSPWVPLSGPIVRSLVSHWWAWLVFYALAGALGAAWLGLFLFGVTRLPSLTVLIAGPLLAAMLLIDARLLGRLAWRASLSEEEDEEQRPAKPPAWRRERAPTISEFD